jgi:hypothetical protein
MGPRTGQERDSKREERRVSKEEDLGSLPEKRPEQFLRRKGQQRSAPHRSLHVAYHAVHSFSERPDRNRIPDPRILTVVFRLPCL